MDIQNNIEIFKLILENATNHIVITDIDGRVLYANRGAEIITGYSRKEMIGKTPKLWGGLMNEDFYKKLWTTIKEQKKPFNAEIKNRRKNGEIYYSLLHISPILNKDNKLLGFTSTEEDISKIKNLTKSLEEQKSYLRKIIDTDPHFLFAKNWDGKFTLANKAVAEVYGTTPENLLGKSDADFNKNKAEVKHFLKDDREVITSGEPRFVPEEPVTNSKTGVTRWYQTIKIPLDIPGQPRQILGVSTDITERKLYEEIIQVEKKKDEAILKSIGEGMIATDDLGRITIVNKVAEDLLGWKFQQLKGRKLIELIPLLNESGDTIQPSSRPLNKALTENRPIVISSYYYVKKNKTRIPIAATVTPIKMKNRIIGTIEIFRDITHDLEIDRAKTEFVSLAAHQLRAPLTTIRWYSEYLLMKDKNDSPVKQQQYLREIYFANNRMIDLVDSLLNVSRVELGTFMIEPVEIDLVHLAKNIIQELKTMVIQKKLTIHEHYGKQKIIVKADLNLARIILQNLLTNAIKYSLYQGKIDLSISAVDKILIKITDSGIGIDPKNKPKIFTKFFRGDNAKSIDPEGNGLGLYIIKSLLAHTKGKIWFESKKSKGTTFFVTFPKTGMLRRKGTKIIQ